MHLSRTWYNSHTRPTHPCIACCCRRKGHPLPPIQGAASEQQPHAAHCMRHVQRQRGADLPQLPRGGNSQPGTPAAETPSSSSSSRRGRGGCRRSSVGCDCTTNCVRAAAACRIRFLALHSLPNVEGLMHCPMQADVQRWHSAAVTSAGWAHTCVLLAQLCCIFLRCIMCIMLVLWKHLWAPKARHTDQHPLCPSCLTSILIAIASVSIAACIEQLLRALHIVKCC
jgi:hypothetical protein